jgi:hypothetical protein
MLAVAAGRWRLGSVMRCRPRAVTANVIELPGHGERRPVISGRVWRTRAGSAEREIRFSGSKGSQTGLPPVRLHFEAPNGAMPPAVQALGVAMHIRSDKPEMDPAALAHEMFSLLRSVRTTRSGRDSSHPHRGHPPAAGQNSWTGPARVWPTEVAGHGDAVMPDGGRAGHSRLPASPGVLAASIFTATSRPARPRLPGRPPSAGRRPRPRSAPWRRPRRGRARRDGPGPQARPAVAPGPGAG